MKNDLSQARAGAYLLLADLVGGPLTPELLDAAGQASDRVGAALWAVRSTAADDTAAFDAIAAEHYAVFEAGVFPCTRVFLGDGSIEPLDQALRRLATLGSSPAGAQRVLDERLLRWLPSFTAAVRATGSVFGTAVVDELEDLVLHHRESLRGSPPPTFALPGGPPDLAAGGTGLREIATWLCDAPAAGFFLSAEEIRRLARDRRLPRGFGRRADELTHLLRSAARFEAFGDLLGQLTEIAEDRAVALRSPRYDLPALAPQLAPWLGRIERTVRTLEQLAGEAEAA